MDDKTLFRNLVTNKHMPRFDYFGRSFSFQTVFYISAYSYHCCPCAFEHEYLDYISETGDINENVYEKIVACVNGGQCPHVYEVSPDHVTETKIYGIHVAAAVGTEKAFIGYRSRHNIGPVGLFGINPVHMAFLKDQPGILKLLLNIYPQSPFKQFLFHSYRDPERTNTIQVEHVSFIELCARKKSVKLLNTFMLKMSKPIGISKAFVYSFSQNLYDIEDALLEHITKCDKEASDCAEITVVYNKPKAFEWVLKHLSTLPSFSEDRLYLHKICSILNRTECMRILKQSGEYEPTKLFDVQYTEVLIGLLFRYYDRLKDEIVPKLKRCPDTLYVINRADTYNPSQLHLYLEYDFPRINTSLVGCLLDLGSNVDGLFRGKFSALYHVISLQTNEQKLFYQKIRETIEIFLNHNPDLEISCGSKTFKGSAIDLAISIDCRLNLTLCKLDKTGSLTIDGKMHTYSRHDDYERYALNYLVPLLIECGMPYSLKDISDIPKKSLHPTEQDYLQKCLDNPRSLKLRCRDVLRRQFKGMVIHTYMEAAEIPQSLKEFILLKHELLLIN